MEDEEHEVYGQEIPVDGEDVDMAAGDDATKLQELDDMKRRLKEMEEEAAALREMQAKVAKEMQDPNATTSENKEEMDSRSVFIGNVSLLSSSFSIKVLASGSVSAQVLVLA
ncbi:Polyadenylate-binding protein 3 [Zea mays]|uniref:Polyadenylate-binding protein 3 n=1 Tax=Zea mays TaxID=4577 RepID=A0A1D6LVH1_MAIZE|nr:Polyadenylate-binding protein 3 [Zea mays]